MLLSVILNVHNEGDEVRNTIKNIRQKVRHFDLEFIVVDDASTDGSCVGLGKDVTVIRNDDRIGCGRCKNKGVAIAKGEVFLFTDGHARVFDEKYPLDSAIALSTQKQAIIAPAVGPFREEGLSVAKSKWYHSDIVLNDNGFLKLKWISKPTQEPYQVVYGPSPSFFIIPADVLIDRIGGWLPFRGRWGSQELGLALRAWFTGVPILSVPDFVVAHKFKKRFSYEVSQNRDIYVNTCQTHLICFDDETYKNMWEPKLKLQGNYEEVKDLIFDNAALNDHKQFINKYKVKTDRKFFYTFSFRVE